MRIYIFLWEIMGCGFLHHLPFCLLTTLRSFSTMWPTTACYFTTDYKQPSQLIMEKILDMRSQNKSFLFVEFYFWFSSSWLSNTSYWCLNWPPYPTSYQETLDGYSCSMLIHSDCLPFCVHVPSDTLISHTSLWLLVILTWQFQMLEYR